MFKSMLSPALLSNLATLDRTLQAQQLCGIPCAGSTGTEAIIVTHRPRTQLVHMAALASVMHLQNGAILHSRSQR